MRNLTYKNFVSVPAKVYRLLYDLPAVYCNSTGVCYNQFKLNTWLNPFYRIPWKDARETLHQLSLINEELNELVHSFRKTLIRHLTALSTREFDKSTWPDSFKVPQDLKPFYPFPFQETLINHLAGFRRRFCLPTYSLACFLNKLATNRCSNVRLV